MTWCGIAFSSMIWDVTSWSVIIYHNLTCIVSNMIQNKDRTIAHWGKPLVDVQSVRYWFRSTTHWVYLSYWVAFFGGVLLFYFIFCCVFLISTPRKRCRVHREMNKTYYYIKYNSYILNIYHDIWYAIYFLLYFQASDLRIVIAAFSESAARQVFCEVCFGLQKVFFSN